MIKNNTLFKEILIHALIWICLYGITYIHFLFQFKTVPTDFYYRSALYIGLFYLNYSVLAPQLLLKKKTTYYLLSAISIIVLVVWISKNFFFNEFHPVHRFDFPNPDEMRRDFEERFGGPKPIFMPYLMPALLLSFHFVVGSMIRLYMEWNKNEILRKRIETEKVNSELQFLKTQLNPHFLFNSLNAIYSLSVKKSADTSEAIINLSELMRYMLYEANMNVVPLEKEINYIKNYILLQRLRLSNSEEVTFNIYGDERNKTIAPLLFISFIENAFKYGTDYKGKTAVKITITITDNELHLFVKNKIGSFRKKDENSGVGLENIKSRLQLLYPSAHSLKVEDDGDYYTVNLTLNITQK